jgi:hypothetical protein
MAPPHKRLSILGTGDPKLAPGIDKSDNGRVAHNARYAKEKEGVRALDDNRGLKLERILVWPICKSVMME